MGLSRHINSFNVYNVLLIIIFSLTVNGFFYSTINIFFLCNFAFFGNIFRNLLLQKFTLFYLLYIWIRPRSNLGK